MQRTTKTAPETTPRDPSSFADYLAEARSALQTTVAEIERLDAQLDAAHIRSESLDGELRDARRDLALLQARAERDASPEATSALDAARTHVADLETKAQDSEARALEAKIKGLCSLADDLYSEATRLHAALGDETLRAAKRELAEHSERVHHAETAAEATRDAERHCRLQAAGRLKEWPALLGEAGLVTAKPATAKQPSPARRVLGAWLDYANTLASYGRDVPSVINGVNVAGVLGLDAAAVDAMIGHKASGVPPASRVEAVERLLRHM